MRWAAGRGDGTGAAEMPFTPFRISRGTRARGLAPVSRPAGRRRCVRLSEPGTRNPEPTSSEPEPGTRNRVIEGAVTSAPAEAPPPGELGSRPASAFADTQRQDPRTRAPRVTAPRHRHRPYPAPPGASSRPGKAGRGRGVRRPQERGAAARARTRISGRGRHCFRISSTQSYA